MPDPITRAQEILLDAAREIAALNFHGEEPFKHWTVVGMISDLEDMPVLAEPREVEDWERRFDRQQQANDYNRKVEA